MLSSCVESSDVESASSDVPSNDVLDSDCVKLGDDELSDSCVPSVETVGFAEGWDGVLRKDFIEFSSDSSTRLP